jgi:hypothetical protein
VGRDDEARDLEPGRPGNRFAYVTARRRTARQEVRRHSRGERPTRRVEGEDHRDPRRACSRLGARSTLSHREERQRTRLDQRCHRVLRWALSSARKPPSSAGSVPDLRACRERLGLDDRVGVRGVAFVLRRLEAGTAPDCFPGRSSSLARGLLMRRPQWFACHWPPSARTNVPVTSDARGEARNTTSAATSSGRPWRPNADCFATDSYVSGSFRLTTSQ